MKIIAGILLCLLVSQHTVAQRSANLESFGGTGAVGMAFAQMRHKKGINSDLPTVGSIYLEDAFAPCTIFYNEELVGNFFYRHNAYNDEIEIKDTQLAEEAESSLATLKELRLIDQTANKELSLNLYRNKDGEVRNGYLYTLSKGKNYILYFKNNVKFTEGTHPVSSMVRPTPNKFTHFTEYYFKTSDGKIAEFLSPKKGDFLEGVVKDLREQVKKYLKEEKINLKRESDLVTLFGYLNSI